MDSLQEIKARMKGLVKAKGTSSHRKVGFIKIFNKLLIVIILVISTLIWARLADGNRALLMHHLFDKHFQFASLNNTYTKYLGDVLPLKNIGLVKDKTVFKEQLQYKEANKYLKGVKLTVADHYLIPVVKSGIVVFIGDKDDYGKTIIIQQTNGVDLWYGNIEQINVSMYDYVEEGMLLGEVNGKDLYLVFQKGGEFLNYKEFIK